MCTSSVSNVIYHKFSHGAAFCTLNGKNVNVMLEFKIHPPVKQQKSFKVFFPSFSSGGHLVQQSKMVEQFSWKITQGTFL